MRKVIYLVLAVVFLSLTVRSLYAQQVFKTTSKSVIGYLEYLPPDYHANSDKYPIVIFLHGQGEKGINSNNPSDINTTIQKVAKIGPPMHVKNGTKFPFILISPQLKSNYGTWPSSYVMEVINHVKTYLRIDEKRILITGLSLGGGGAWVAVQDYPELFAAVAPVCGGYNSPSKACGIAKENLPVWAFHGDADKTVGMSKSVNMVNAINACTPKPNPLAKMTIYPGVGHSSWTNAYKTDNTIHKPNVYEWMLSFTNTVNKGNKIPVANAGADKTGSVGTAVSLKGTGTDSDGTISSYSWKQLSGPSNAKISSPSSANTNITMTIAGTYEFGLTVKDNSGNTDTDYVRITVQNSSTNTLPTVNAGADKTITLPTNSVTFTGTASDADGSIASYAWTKVSGGNAVLSGANTSKLTASSLVAGTYVFRLTVTDNKGGKKSDDVSLVVKSATTSTGNIAPVANAGPDKTVTLPTTSINLVGSGSDADGTIKYYKWAKVSGPSVYMYGVSKSTLELSNMRVGTYVFKLTVTDNAGATGVDQVTVVVKDVVTSATSVNNAEITTLTGEEVVIGKLGRSSLDNSFVTIYNAGGESVYSGVWDEARYLDIVRQKGLYIFNVQKNGRVIDSGKVMIR